MFSVTRNFRFRRCFNFRFIHERMFWEELDDYPEVIQSSFLTLKQSARTVFVSRCFGFVFRGGGCFECDIIFVEKRERVLQIEVAFSSSCFRKIMFGFTYLWWGCDYYDNLCILMEHSNTYICV